MGRKIEYFYEALKNRRAVMDNTLHLAADYVMPERGGFQKERVAGENERRKVYDTTAIQANRLFASFVNSMLTNPATVWFDLEVEGLESDSIEKWLDDVRNGVYSVVNDEQSGFKSSTPMLYQELGAFGNSVLQGQYIAGKGFKFKTIPFSDCWFNFNEEGEVLVCMRRFKLTAMEAAEKFGDDLPSKVKKCLNDKPMTEFEFYHIVYKDNNQEGLMAKPFVGAYYFPEEKKTIRQTKLRWMPYFPFRINEEAGFEYGVGNFQYARGNILLSNIMAVSIIRGSQKLIDPPILAPNDGFIVRGGLGPGDVAYYDSSIGDGANSVRALDVRARPDIGQQVQAEENNKIRDAFFVNQLQFAADADMTATEAQLRNQSNMQLMAPVVGSLGRDISRVIDWIFNVQREEMGMYLEGPEELEGKDFKVRFLGPLAKAQRMEETQALNKTIQDAAGLLQADPSPLQIFKGEDTLRKLSKLNGVPADLLHSPEEMEAINQQAQQQQAIQQVADNGPAVVETLQGIQNAEQVQ